MLIGAPRCASTAIAVALGKHSDIYVCEPKEPHFLALWGSDRQFSGVGAEAFGQNRVYNEERWKKLFINRTERYLMDSSVSTISYPDTSIPNIKKYCAADTRIIAILRDPVERAFSSYMYCVSRGWDAGSFEQSLQDEEFRIENNWQHLWYLKYLSDYEQRLRPFLDAFPRRDIHIVITEEFSANSVKVLNDLYEFLDLPAIEVEDTGARLNSSGNPKSLLMSDMVSFVRNRPQLREYLQKISSPGFREFIKSRNIRKVDMDSDTRKMLTEAMKETKPWTQQLVGRELHDWN